MYVNGNVYLNGARSHKGEDNQLIIDADPKIQLEELEGAVYLSMILDKAIAKMKNQGVSTALLGKAQISDQRFENPDGSEIVIDMDYTSKKRNLKNPSPGPFNLGKEQSLRIKVWPKN